MKKFKFILLFCLFQVQPFSLQAAEFLITSEVKLMEKRRFFPPRNKD